MFSKLQVVLYLLLYWGLIWDIVSIYLIRLRINDKNNKLLSSGMAVLFITWYIALIGKLYTISSLQCLTLTLYLQLQFIKVYCTVNPVSAIKCSLKKRQMLAKQLRNLNNENKSDGNKESIKQYKKEKYAEHWISNFMFWKARYQENPEV